jgi:hypothetical protein
MFSTVIFFFLFFFFFFFGSASRPATVLTIALLVVCYVCICCSNVSDVMLHSYSSDLIQVFAPGIPRGPHTDVWLWTPDHESTVSELFAPSNEEELIVTKDHLVVYRWRQKSDIFPLKKVDYAGLTLTIPHDSHGISKKEFSVYSGSYMKPKVFRADCFHNFFNLRWLF